MVEKLVNHELAARKGVRHTMTGSITSSDVAISTSPLPSSRKRKRASTTSAELEVDINAPEPPSKKALRKAKKAKTNKVILPYGTGNVNIKSNPKSKEEEEEEDADADAEAEAEGLATSPVAKRSDYGIWIGNLPWSASKIDVRNFITTNTNITDAQITRLHMPAPREGPSNTPRPHVPKARNKGFAYIDFSTAAALTQAMALTETLLTGRRLLVKDSKSFEGRPEKPMTREGDGTTAVNTGKPANKRIFIGNLGFDTSEKDLREHFARCGPVEHVHMATFEDSGKCKGFAWVEFEDLAAGEAAVRGWVHLESVQSDEEEEDEEAEEADEEDVEQSKEKSEEDSDKAAHNKGPAAASTKKKKKAAPKKKPRRPRKWWVNKLHGRLLRMEFAEDKAVRYKKRYGSKGAVRKEEADSKANDVPATAAATGRAEKADPAIPLPPSDPNSQVVHQTSHPPRSSASSSKPARRTKSMGSVAAGLQSTPVARSTGGIVASEGRKIIFT